MPEFVEYGGKVWRRYPESKSSSSRDYFRCGKKCLHRQVWIDHHGEIPQGFQIHHKDGDKGNNDIANLECVTPREHSERHWTPERSEQQRRWLEKIRPLASEWHKSEDGKDLHKRLGALAHKKFVPVDKACEHCGKVFTPGKIGNLDKFCSNACKSAARRKSGVDNVVRICPCGREFTCNKYSKQRFCSRTCSNHYARWNRKESVRPDS